MSAPIGGQLSPGKLFHGHYEVVRCLSTGAMGAVYEVIDNKTHRRRALKVMLPSLVTDEDMRERFKLEATVTAHIESEHIVETFDADVDPETGAPFLVMELLRGTDLADVLGERKRLSPVEVVLILTQAARALDKTHVAGIVHRDLKPENIFITKRDDGSLRIKILDFGIAKVVAASEGPSKKQQTINLGTPPYMSPEQILGDATIDHRADLYSLAHIAYALLVGEPYWLEESRNGDTLYRLLLRMVDGVKEPPTQRALRYGVTLPAAFDPWFFRATAKAPSERYNRASDLVVDLAKVLGVPLQHRGPSPTTPDSEWELESVMLTSTAVHRLVQVPADAPMSTPTPSVPQAQASFGPPPFTPAPGSRPSFAPAANSRPSFAPPPVPGGFVAPNQAVSIPPLPGVPSLQPSVGPATQDKSARKAVWALLLLVLFSAIGGVAIAMGVLGGDSSKNAATGASSAPPVEPPAASSEQPVVAAPPDASAPEPAESAASVVTISATASSPAATVLPPGTSIGKTSPTVKRKTPGTEPTTTKKSGTYDPLREL